MLANITLVSECPPRRLGGVSVVFFKFFKEIHVGDVDCQRNPDNVTALVKLTGWGVTVVEGAGHTLPQEYVGAMLERRFSA